MSELVLRARVPDSHMHGGIQSINCADLHIIQLVPPLCWKTPTVLTRGTSLLAAIWVRGDLNELLSVEVTPNPGHPHPHVHIFLLHGLGQGRQQLPSVKYSLKGEHFHVFH